MKASDLRIGCFIGGLSNTYEVIECVTNEEVDTDKHFGMPISKIKPIPLTEEWLLKFGFKGRVDFKWIYTGDKFGVHFIDGKMYGAIKDISNVFYRTSIELIHVHQLQNLYHSLTNKELEIC